VRQATAVALASVPGLAVAAVHVRAMRLIDRWPVSGPEAPLGERIWVAADNWVIRMWPFVVITGVVLSIAVVILLSRRLAWQRPPEILVADFRAWALVVLVLEVMGAGLMWRPGRAFYSLLGVFLALSWVRFIARVVSCANLVAVLRQLRPDLRLRGAAVGGYALYFALGSIGPLVALFAAPFIARLRSRAVV